VFKSEPQFNTLLESEETTLEMVLLDKNMLGELRNLNEKLLSFFNDDRLKELIEIANMSFKEDKDFKYD
jgi:hypothetical protein